MRIGNNCFRRKFYSVLGCLEQVSVGRRWLCCRPMVSSSGEKWDRHTEIFGFNLLIHGCHCRCAVRLTLSTCFERNHRFWLTLLCQCSWCTGTFTVTWPAELCRLLFILVRIFSSVVLVLHDLYSLGLKLFGCTCWFTEWKGQHW